MDLNTVFLALITALGAAFGAWLTYRANATHKAVNSERTAMTAELQKQNTVIAQLATHLGALTGSTDLTELGRSIAPGVETLASQVGQAATDAAVSTPTTPPVVAPPGAVVAQIIVPKPAKLVVPKPKKPKR